MDAYPIPNHPIDPMTVFIRGNTLLIDRDLASLCGIPTRQLMEKVHKTPRRFPKDFLTKLTMEEKEELIMSHERHSILFHSPAPPFAFTLYGAAMAASLFTTPQAVDTTIHLLRSLSTQPPAIPLERAIPSPHAQAL